MSSTTASLTKFNQAPMMSEKTLRHLPALLTVVVVMFLLMALPSQAHAASGISIPFITEFGCSVVQWLKGPLAVLIFVIVCVGTLVIGMISKMDWSTIITVCVIFGVVIGLGNILSTSSYVTGIAGMSACLQ